MQNFTLVLAWAIITLALAIRFAKINMFPLPMSYIVIDVSYRSSL